MIECYVIPLGSLQLVYNYVIFCSHSLQSDFWSISTTEHALPLRPVQVLKIALALAPSFDTASLAISYIIPTYNNVIFMNVENGANISVNLKGRIKLFY